MRADSLTEWEIQKLLYYQYQAEWSIPNFSSRWWWECDWFRVLRSGYTEESEIKLSISDFRADFKKESLMSGLYVKKHDLLSRKIKAEEVSRDKRMKPIFPNRFYFVVPEKIHEKALKILPEYAGLRYVHKDCYYLVTAKQAPQLHKEKVDERILREISYKSNRRYLWIKYHDLQVNLNI